MENLKQRTAIVDPNTQSAFEMGPIIRYIYSLNLDIIVPLYASNYTINEIADINFQFSSDYEVSIVNIITRANTDGKTNSYYPYEVCAQLNLPYIGDSKITFDPTSYCNYEYRLRYIGSTEGMAPEILSFETGLSNANPSNVEINEMTGNLPTTGYIVTESSGAPNVNDAGWSPMPPTEFSF